MSLGTTELSIVKALIYQALGIVSEKGITE